MSYDYFAINYASVAGIIFLLIFLSANATIDRWIKKNFYLMVLIEFIEMLTYSLELWTTTFETLSPLRLWLSAIGYSIRPFIIYIMLILAMRNTSLKRFSKLYSLPAVANIVASFSVFFTDIVYSYSPDNKFLRGPLGFSTHIVVLLYLIILAIIVIRNHAGRPPLEVLIIFANCLLIVFSMVIEAVFSVRTVGRTTLIMVTIFYYMFFQTQIHRTSLSKEQTIRQQLEYANRIDESTGVLNKRAFTEAAKSLLSSSNVRKYSSVSFLFMDMDHLKTLNDTLGHTTGDIAIADFAKSIQAICRKSDLIGRFGGDEFCILIPDISKEHLPEFLVDMQRNLRKTYSSDCATIEVTVSIGAVYTENLTQLSYDRLIKIADEALYEAKARGRNCHIVREL